MAKNPKSVHATIDHIIPLQESLTALQKTVSTLQASSSVIPENNLGVQAFASWKISGTTISLLDNNNIKSIFRAGIGTYIITFDKPISENAPVFVSMKTTGFKLFTITSQTESTVALSFNNVGVLALSLTYTPVDVAGSILVFG